MLSGCVVPLNSFYHGNLNVCFIIGLTTCSKWTTIDIDILLKADLWYVMLRLNVI